MRRNTQWDRDAYDVDRTAGVVAANKYAMVVRHARDARTDVVVYWIFGIAAALTIASAIVGRMVELGFFWSN